MFSNAIPSSSYKLLKKSCLYTKAIPLISSTTASAVVLLFLKFAVIAMASFPLNSFLTKPKNSMFSSFINHSINHDQVIIYIYIYIYIYKCLTYLAL